MRVVAVLLVVLLYLLHQDFWFWGEARPLVVGFLPIGLFYHAAFTAGCSIVLWLLVKHSWPAHLEGAGLDHPGNASQPDAGPDLGPTSR